MSDAGVKAFSGRITRWKAALGLATRTLFSRVYSCPNNSQRSEGEEGNEVFIGGICIRELEKIHVRWNSDSPSLRKPLYTYIAKVLYQCSVIHKYMYALDSKKAIACCMHRRSAEVSGGIQWNALNHFGYAVCP